MPAPSQPLRGSPSPVDTGEGWGGGRHSDSAGSNVAFVPRRLAPVLALAVLLGLGACSGAKITEDRPDAVAIRYDGIAQTLDDVTAIANRACGAYRKTARLREVYTKAAFDRVAHFTCVGG